MPTVSRTLLSTLLLALPLYAQQGDRKGHERMDPIVPENLIPPAPVLSVEDALKSFTIAPGFTIEPVVAEPLIEKPVALKFDGDGRMWVCEMVGYMTDIDGSTEAQPQGRIVILEDSDHNGSIDKRTVFLEKLLLPRAIYLLDDGILWADQGSLYFVPREGDKPSGKQVVVDPDYAKGGNVEHKANGLLSGLDNWIYSAKSDRRYKRINGAWVMEKTHFRGQWGISQDDFGRLYHNNNSTLLVGDFLLPNTVFGNNNVRVNSRIASTLGSNRVWPIRVTPAVNRGYINELNGYRDNTIDPKTFKLINATGASGMAIYRGDQFPRKAYGTAFVTEPTGNLVKAITIAEGDGKLTGEHPYGEKEFLASTDERFRPVDAVTAPDGSLYIIDFYHGIIQHKTYVTTYLRQQYLSRKLDGPGYGYGRIYRVRASDKDLGPAPNMQSLAAKDLIPFLSHPNGWWRDTAQRLIVERGDASLAADLTTLLGTPSQPLGQLHALWCLEGLGLLTTPHIEVMLNSGEEQLASSALFAALSLQDAFLPSAIKAVIAYKPGKTSAIYKARFLAGVRSTAAAEALVTLLQKHGDRPLVREAAFAGLKGREANFLHRNDRRFNNKEFLGWLKDASSKDKNKVAPRKLEGDHLASFQRGEDVYQGEAGCIGCHGIEGTGLPNLGPPLDGSDWVTGDTTRLISVLLHGLMGPITVSGERYAPPAAMPGLGQNPTITDQNLADVATYLRQGWDNRAPAVPLKEVQSTRAATKDRNGALYTEADFK
ncbi:MAG: c-type cytochrome [Verrucomicrobia bacterium]|nr:c-type cytochrome [Verrucomicrobiota bacterium]